VGNMQFVTDSLFSSLQLDYFKTCVNTNLTMNETVLQWKVW